MLFRSGLPVIAARNDGSAEIVEDEHTGYLYAIGDVSELAKGMGQLCDGADVVHMMGEAARARVGRIFAWKTVAEKIKYIYKNNIAQND